MADKLGKSDSQISQLLGKKQMGPDIAREIEATLNLPHGWMDDPHPDLTPAALDVASKYQALAPADQETVRNLISRLEK